MKQEEKYHILDIIWQVTSDFCTKNNFSHDGLRCKGCFMCIKNTDNQNICTITAPETDKFTFTITVHNAANEKLLAEYIKELETKTGLNFAIE